MTLLRRVGAPVPRLSLGLALGLGLALALTLTLALARARALTLTLGSRAREVLRAAGHGDEDLGLGQPPVVVDHLDQPLGRGRRHDSDPLCPLGVGVGVGFWRRG